MAEGMRMRISASEKYKNDLDAVIRGTSGLDELYCRRIVVTGAGGMLGSFLVDTLLRINDVCGTGMTVYAAGRNTDRLKERFGIRRDISFLKHDLLQPPGFEDLSPHYIIHAAGNSDPAAFNTDPTGTLIGNINGTYELLKYAGRNGCYRFLYVSSGEVYGIGEPDVESYDESCSGYVDPLSVRSCYPMSKRAAENLCVSYSGQYHLDTVIVRPCHIYGPGFRSGDSHAYVQFLKDALAGKDIVMKSAGAQIRSYIYVADCVSGILTALLQGKNCQAYNIANPDSTVSVAGLAKEIAVAAGVNVTFENPDEKDVRDRSPIPRQVLNSDKLASLGFRPVFGISEGIRHTYEILQSCEENQ